MNKKFIKYIGWAVGLLLLSAVGGAYIDSLPSRIAAAEQKPAPRVIYVADPNQSMEGSYCDRIAAVGKSLVNGRNKGTRRTSVENLAATGEGITDVERVMYKQMIAVVYDEPITEDAMYARVHKSCDEATAELTQAADTDAS